MLIEGSEIQNNKQFQEDRIDNYNLQYITVEPSDHDNDPIEGETCSEIACFVSILFVFYFVRSDKEVKR